MTLQENLTNFENRQIILAGDFNMVADPQLDYIHHGVRFEEGERRILAEICLDHNLVDYFRVTNPASKAFTYFHQAGGGQETVPASRLDRVYVRAGDLELVRDHKFVPKAYTDHVAIQFTMKLEEAVHTRTSHWKLNTSILENPLVCDRVRELILDWVTIQETFNNKVLWWEALKIRIRQELVKFSKILARERHENRTRLEDQLSNLLEAGLNNQNNFEHFRQIKLQLFEFQKAEERSSFLMSKVRDIQEDERMSPYFFRKSRQTAERKLFKALKNKNGEIKGEQEEMEEIVHDFYQDLYSTEQTDGTIQAQVLALDKTRLSENDKQSCEGLLSQQELEKALRGMARGKTPGCDGLPMEFYLKFWDVLANPLTMALNDIFVHGCLTDTQRLALMALLYKKKCHMDLGNWRPISLLCVDFKLVTKSLANRLRPVLPKLIMQYQTCSVKGRNIFDNLYTIQNVIEMANFKQHELFIVCLDQLKAFDRLDHGWMIQVLKHYNFGGDFVRWITVLYGGIASKAVVNGHLTRDIQVQRGVRQGCPLSPLLYIICMQPVANELMLSSGIRGSSLLAKPIKILQYADDTVCFIQDEQSISTLLSLYEKYQMVTGAKLNVSKTEILRVGRPRVGTRSKLSISEPLRPMVRPEVKVLGIRFGSAGASQNQWEDIVDRIRDLIRSWASRRMGVRGRTILIKSTALAQLWYTARVVPLSRKLADRVEHLCAMFIWNRGYEPRQREHLYLPSHKGGLDFPMVFQKCRALLAHRLTLAHERDRMWADSTLYWTRLPLRRTDPRLNLNSIATSLSRPRLYDQVLGVYTDYQDIKTECWREKTVKEIYQVVTSRPRVFFVPKFYSFNVHLNWEETWRGLDKYVQDPSAWSTCWEALHRTLKVGDNATKRNIKSNVTHCVFCNNPKETIPHLFVECTFAQRLKQELDRVLVSEVGSATYTEAQYLFQAVHELNLGDEKKRRDTAMLWAVAKHTLWAYRGKILATEERPEVHGLLAYFRVLVKTSFQGAEGGGG
jgi:hypothetical protein